MRCWPPPVAVLLALLSLRLRGLGLALMTLAFALFMDATFFNAVSITGGPEGVSIPSKWLGTSEFFNFDGHAMFLLSLGVLIVAVIVVLLVRRGTVGRNLAAMRGSETATAGLGVNPSWQRIMVFALSGAVAGVGGLLHSLEQQVVSPTDWNADFSLVLVVLVVTTSVTTVEGAIQAGIGFFVTEQILTTVLPARIGASSLTVVLFAFGALTYAQHPEGVLEFQKRRGTQRFERLFFAREAEAEDLKAARHLDIGCQWLTRPRSSACATCASPSAGSRPSTASPSTCSPARASAWSVPTAPARRRSSTACAGSCGPSKATSSSTGRPSAGMPDLQARPPRHRPHLPAGRGLHRHVGARPPHGGRAVAARRGPPVAGPVQHEQARPRTRWTGSTPSWSWSGSPSWPTRRSMRWASAIAAWSSWRGRWPPSRRSCWPTSRRRASTCTKRRSWLPSCASVQRERGTAVLLVEHDLSMVAEVVDRTVVMDLGVDAGRRAPSTR